MSNSSPIRNGTILLLASLLYACQGGPPVKEYSEEYLVQSGDVPAVRVFEGKTGDGGTELWLSSAQDEYGEKRLVLCGTATKRFANKSTVQCYRYDSSAHTAHRTNTDEARSFFEKIMSERRNNGHVSWCTKFNINKPFMEKIESTFLRRASSLWLGEKQIPPLAGRLVIGAELSPDGKTAAVLSSDGLIGNPLGEGIGIMILFPPSRDNPRTPEFQHYHQFYDMESGKLSKPVRLPLAINGFPMHGCWSPDGKYVIYYGGDDYPVEIKPENGGKYPDYAAIVHLEERHE